MAQGAAPRASLRSGVWAASSACLLVAFAAFTVAERWFGIRALNLFCRSAVDRITIDGLHWLSYLFAASGSPAASVALTGMLAAGVGASRGPRNGALVVAAMALMTALESVLRIRFEALPWEHLMAFIKHPRGWHLQRGSYPSGHVARFALLSGITAGLYGLRRMGRAVCSAVLVTLTMGIQRVHSGFHTGTDVVGGALLGWTFTSLYLGVVLANREAQSASAPRESRP